MSNLPLYVITFLAYSVLAAYFWRAQTAGKIDVLNRGMIGHAVLLPLALHAYLLYSSLFSSGDLNLGLINALSLILWLTMLVYWVARFFYPIASLQTLVLPLAAGGVLLLALFPTVHPLANNLSFVLEAHILAAMSRLQSVHHCSAACGPDVIGGKTPASGYATARAARFAPIAHHGNLVVPHHRRRLCFAHSDIGVRRCLFRPDIWQAVAIQSQNAVRFHFLVCVRSVVTRPSI